MSAPVGLAGVKKGDEVVVADVNRPGARRAPVEAVGRKYATIEGYKHEIATGARADAHRHARAYTLEQWERIQAVVALRNAANRVCVGGLAHLSIDEIRELTAGLDAITVKLAGGAS